MIWEIVLAVSFLGGSASDAKDDKPLLRDIYGTEHYFDDFKAERTRATVFIMLDDMCPVVKQQLPKLRELHRKYNGFERDRAGHPVGFEKYPGDEVQIIGVYTKPDLGAKEMAKHAMEAGLPFRVLRDTRYEFAKTFHVTRLSEAIVFDRDWKVVYQGPIDDQSVQGATKARPTVNYLEEVLDSIIAGKPSPHKRVPPVGCLIDTDVAQDSPKVTYADVEPIIRKRCVPCHQEGEVGPMPLSSYAGVRDYAAMVEEVITEERMPPWPAVSKLPLRNALSLTKDEREKLLGWLRSDMPRGDMSLANIPISTTAPAPKAKSAPTKRVWKIGEPDFVFEMPKPITVPATGVVDYLYIPIEINGGQGFPEDRWIEAIESQPGVAEVVHHMQVHEYHGRALGGKIDPIQQLLHYGLSIDNARLLGSYTPGNLEENARIYANFVSTGQTAAMKLRRGSNLLLEMHYTPNGKEVQDRSAVAIRFAKKPPEVVVETWFPFRKRPDLMIPANVERHSLQDRYHFGSKTGGKTILLHGVRPHLHSRGKSYRLELIQANCMTDKDLYNFSEHDKVRGEVILSMPVWDFNWQHFYRFEKPLVIRPDQALLATATWDNSKFNPRNPDANSNVPWGQQTNQEMFNTLFNYEILEPGDPRLAAAAEEKR